jgi:hypothetical protein
MRSASRTSRAPAVSPLAYHFRFTSRALAQGRRFVASGARASMTNFPLPLRGALARDLSQIDFSGRLDAMQGGWKARQSKVPDETIRSTML